MATERLYVAPLVLPTAGNVPHPPKKKHTTVVKCSVFDLVYIFWCEKQQQWTNDAQWGSFGRTVRKNCWVSEFIIIIIISNELTPSKLAGVRGK